MPLLRVVLDTNVLVSALVFRSPFVSWLLNEWQSLTFIPLASQTTMAELERVMRHPKFNLFRTQAEALIEDYRPWCEMVTIADPPDVPECRDPRDRPFLELAVAAEADALVTGDGDLLALAPVFAIPIITPAVLLLLRRSCGLGYKGSYDDYAKHAARAHCASLRENRVSGYRGVEVHP